MANANTTSMQFPTNLPIFKGENYERWVAQMKVVFRFQNVAEIACDGVPTLEVNASDVQKVARKEQRKNDGKALFLDHQYVDPNMFEKIIEEETSKEA